MSPAFRRLLALLFCLFPSTALAQSSITTSTALPVPIAGPWVVPVLTILLIAGAWWVLRSRGLRHAGAVSVALSLAVVVGAAGALHALTLEFSNPEGETLLVPIDPEFADEHIAAWEPVDFTNNSGQSLQIVDVTAPAFEECVTENGLDGVVLEASPDPSPYPLCEVDAILAPGETCRADVDAMCRAAALTGMATLTFVEAASGGVPGGDEVTIYGTNLSTAHYVMFGGVEAPIQSTTDTSVTVLTPAHAAGTVDVTVITFVGGPTLDDAFTYVAGL